MKTKLSARHMVIVRKKCGFFHGIDVEDDGSKGGMCLGWRQNLDVTLQSYSNHHIDVEIFDETIDISWCLTGFYSHPKERHRHYTWSLLRNLGQDRSLPWLVVGDFNEIAFSFEKSGGRIRAERQMEAFRMTLADCELNDLGYTGN